MQSNQEIDRIALPRSDGHMFNDLCSCPWSSDMGRATLLAIVLGGAVAFTTGCLSTGGGAKGGLIAPVTNSQPGIVRKMAVFTNHHGVQALTIRLAVKRVA
jgi:hypothetical protein